MKSLLFAVSGEHSWTVAGIPEFDWRYWNTDRAKTTDGHKIRLARGKLVGGTSMINATIAARGALLIMTTGLNWEMLDGIGHLCSLF